MGTGSGSKRLRLDGADTQKIGKGAAIAAAGTLLVHLAAMAWPELRTNPELQSAAFVVACVLVNAAWKLWRDNQPSA